MAGEWIKVEAATADKPEVLRMARILQIDRDAVFGKLTRLWAWFDTNSVDGVVDGVVAEDIDRICYCDGFSAACAAVGWLDYDESAERVSLPNFDRHNGETAKQRALKNRRQSKWRESVGASVAKAVDAQPSTSASTREEKRREEVKQEQEPAGSDSPDGDIPPCPHTEIVKLYHELLPTCPRMKVWDGDRAKALRSRWREDERRQSLDYWTRFFNHVAASPFLTGQVVGRDGRTFVADLEWLVKKGNFIKVIENKYHDREIQS